MHNGVIKQKMVFHTNLHEFDGGKSWMLLQLFILLPWVIEHILLGDGL